MICRLCGRCDDGRGKLCRHCATARRADRAEVIIWAICGGALLLIAVEVSRVLMGWSW